MTENIAIVVFSHLRWDFVFQRPQHLLSGLAQHHSVLFIEEPIVSNSSQPEWQFQNVAPNVTVCRPATPCRQTGFHEEQLPKLKQLIRELFDREKLDQYLLWYYTPMALPLAEGLTPAAVIYDC